MPPAIPSCLCAAKRAVFSPALGALCGKSPPAEAYKETEFMDFLDILAKAFLGNFSLGWFKLTRPAAE
jgi:hypothetical protein